MLIPLPPALLALALALVSASAQAPSDPPPSRALSMELCREPRLAGTRGSQRAAEWVAAKLEAAGWQAQIESRNVLLSLPRSSRVTSPGLFERRARFDPDAVPTGDVPLVLAWAKSGTATGEIVDVGRGLRADFEALVAAGVELDGTIALASYGGAYRGVKVAMATEFGCAGALLYSPSTEDGPAKGPTWPAGPWKPAYDAQRGSILPLTTAPGDPSTPGWPSPLIGQAPERAPLTGAALAARLPTIPALPLGSADAQLLLSALAAGRTPRVTLELDMRVERRAIHNVIGTLLPTTGPGGDFVMAGTHRDAWVRGAQDSGSGVVSLLRAAQRLGARYQDGWRPEHELRLAFWDGEETGLFGSTEWAEAHAGEVQAHCLAYLNGDACVSGLNFHASGTPGLLGILSDVLAKQPALHPVQTEAGHEPSILDQWKPRLGLPGSGSDYTVFLHHFGIPILDFGFGGNPGGGYHTAVDDFGLMDRYLDPTWQGHEAAGRLFADLLAEFATRGRASFDAREAVAELKRTFETLNADQPELDLAPLLDALGELGSQVDKDPAAGAHLYARLALESGLPDRPWYTNALWAPGAETGYAAVLLPTILGHENQAERIAELASHVRAALK